MPFECEYTLGNHGWAKVRLGNGEQVAEDSVSYLANPLRDLLRTAAYLLEEPEMRRQHYFRKPATVGYESEPGGLILRVDLNVEPSPDSEVLFQVSTCAEQYVDEEGTLQIQGEKELFVGSTTVNDFARTAFDQARFILEQCGFSHYRTRWIEHEFPLTEFARLAALLGPRELSVSL